MKHLKNLMTVTFLLLGLSIAAQSLDTHFKQVDDFMKAYVKDGKVNYSTIKTDPSELDDLVAQIGTLGAPANDANTFQAFAINAYNLFVIKGVIDNYPIKSPLDVTGFFDKTMYKFSGSDFTLNDIEHELLRARYPQEARFHFVLVCAGQGCPPIINTAYQPATLQEQLQEQTVKSLNDPISSRLKGKRLDCLKYLSGTQVILHKEEKVWPTISINFELKK